MESASRDDGRNKRRERGMMPSALANSGEGGFAEAHFKFMAEHQTDDEFFPTALSALATCDRGRKDIGRVRGILLPINVVVIHAADHQRVRKRCRNWVKPAPGADQRRAAGSGDFVENPERNLHIVLLVAAEGAAHGIEEESFGLINRLG